MITLNTQKYLKGNILILFYFTFFNLTSSFFLYHISYIWGFCYVMYYTVLEICIAQRFLEDCFYCYSQYVISALANKSKYNHLKAALNMDSESASPNNFVKMSK